MRAQRPQPGNRFVSFVRASGRARARHEISNDYLEGFAGWTSFLLLLPGRCVFILRAFSLQFCDVIYQNEDCWKIVQTLPKRFVFLCF